MTKRLPISFLFLLLSTFMFAQTYRNEWIDYSKKYYKFNLGPFGFDAANAPIKTGVVRISQTTLATAGLSTIPAEQFQLWRNGEEVAIYTSKTIGALGAGDYIEFWGEINDGKPDKAMYRNSSYQLSDYFSLHSDTAAYFLTVNPSGNNKRFQPVTNNVSQATIAAEKNFMYTAGRYFHFEISGGYAAVASQNLYSSSYDKGEGWVSRTLRPNECDCGQEQLPQYFGPLYADTSGPAMTFHINSVGDALHNRFVQVYLNNDSIVRYQMDYFFDARINVPGIAANKLKTDDALIIVQDLSADPYDAMKISKIELDYPRKFNFGNKTAFEFNLHASDTGRYIKIVNFDKGSSNPVLYDLTNGKRYVGDVSITDTIRFLLEASVSDYHLALVRGDGSTATPINNLKTREFIDFKNIANQGNYLIISNPLIYGNSGSDDYVEQYKNYRNSEAGGNYNSKIIDINELTDQFAYGIKKHPLSIKNFLNYARNKFTAPPAFVFLIGKGVTYNGYKINETSSYADLLNLVPTWGNPGSDNLLSSADNMNPIPLTPIGRLSAISSKEVGDYLLKVKQYETSQQDHNPSIAERSWTKNVLQIAGANDPELGVLLDQYSKKYQDIISDTIYGGIVTNFSKTSNPAAYPEAVANFKSIYEKGSGLVEYFGHSSSTSLDFSLDNPEAYNNTGKYPLFIVNGCLAGNIFDFDWNRLTSRTTISEKFVLEPQKGAIGYLSTTSFGVLNYLDIYTDKFYHAIAQTQYGKGFGEITKDAITKALTVTGYSDFFGRIHGEQYTFHGDPALKTNSFPKVDYAIDSLQIEISPAYISVADDSFSVKVRIYNLGRATNDSVHFCLYRRFPNGDSVVVFSKQFPSIKTKDSISVKLPVVGNRDKGGVYITASIDDNNKVDELNENNNIATKMVSISDADIRPVFPYNYSIVNSDTVKLSASTSNPLAQERQYLMELDTTALFNSVLKITASRISVGGVIKFDSIALKLNNQVYYWRIAEAGINPHWSLFSFTHNSTANQGFEQAHYFQHLESAADGIKLDSTRNWKFSNKLTNVFVQHSIYPTSGSEENQFSISVNGSFVSAGACIGNSIIFNVFDTLNFKAIPNLTQPFNAAAPCTPLSLDNFEFDCTNPYTRKNAMDFFDNIPKGYYVIAKRNYDIGNEDWAPTVWASDTALYGAGNSLYNRFKNQGLLIDSFYKPRTFVFIFKKDDSAHFTPVSVLSEGLFDRISFTKNIVTVDTSGTITSPKFGPAKVWNKVKWNGFSTDGNDSAEVNVIAINNNAQDSVIYSLNKSQQDFNISGIDAKDYPYVQLRLNTVNTTTGTPYQLKQWLVEYQPVAEGAIAPNLGAQIPDTVTFYHGINVSYDTLAGYVVFKNVSSSNFSPLKVKLTLIDSANNEHPFTLPVTRALPAGDTLHIAFKLNITALPQGVYNFHLFVNPDNDQPEQYLFNNYIYKYITVVRTTTLPVHLVDFTAKPDGANVSLQWVVTNEINFNHYDVEHSLNAKDFVSIGTVEASKLVAGNKLYNLTHTSPVTGKNYYRLKMVDNDGNYTYSPLRLVTFDAVVAGISVYPNPFFSKLNVFVKQTNATSTVRVFNSAGQQIIKKTFSGFVQLEANTLAAGNYMVQVSDGTQKQNFKVQKRN